MELKYKIKRVGISESVIAAFASRRDAYDFLSTKAQMDYDAYYKVIVDD